MSRVSPQAGGKLRLARLFSSLILVLAATWPARAQTTDALHVAVDGKVGIGTEAPEEKLHVSGGRLLLDNEDVETSGMIDVTALQLQLLEKVEELVLYTLQQQEEIDRLTSLVERQAEQISGLQEGEDEAER